MKNSERITIDCISLIGEYEKTISELYKIYEKKFSSLSSFWRQLTVDEKNHEKIIKDYIKNEPNLCLKISSHRFKKYQIEDAIDNIKNLIIESNQNIVLDEALLTSYKFENATESVGFLSSSTEDSDRLKQLLNHLRNECGRHATLIREQLQITKNK